MDLLVFLGEEVCFLGYSLEAVFGREVATWIDSSLLLIRLMAVLYSLVYGRLLAHLYVQVVSLRLGSSASP